jgi:hypothetical protein
VKTQLRKLATQIKGTHHMPKTKAHLIAAIRAKIEDAFEEGDIDGELLMTCPFDQETSYDLYLQADDKKWDIVIDDDYGLGSKNHNHPTLDSAKTRVATLIAEKLLLAKTMLANARTEGLDFE